MASLESVKIKEKAKELIVESKELYKSMDELKEWDSLGEIVNNISKLHEFLEKIVFTVELATKSLESDLKGIQSGDKLDAAVGLLDDLIKLPWYLEVVDEIAFKLLISLVVDQINKRIGKDWDLDKIERVIKLGEQYI